MTKVHSTTTPYSRKPKSKPGKPKKPHKDFPLTPHPSGNWCKKVNGRIYYFGHDADEALQRWLDEKDDLIAGRTRSSRTASPDAHLLRDLVNKFMEAKDAKLRSDELSIFTWRDHEAACNELVSAFGATRPIASLRADDFAKLRISWTDKWSKVRVKKFIVMARGIFKFGYANDIIKTPMKFGTEFETPSLKTMRKDRAAQGIRMFEADELRRLIGAASQPLKAMILLGVNGGMGNHDCATMPLDVVDLDHRWIRYARPKTGITPAPTPAARRPGPLPRLCQPRPRAAQVPVTGRSRLRNAGHSFFAPPAICQSLAEARSRSREIVLN